MRKPSNLSFAILAGGQSRRFGSRKECAEWRGKPLIRWAFELAQQVSDNILFIGDAALNPEPQLVNSYQDIYPGNGPLGGIHASLHHCRTKYIATLPCDMPQMQSRVYHTLAEKRHPQKPVVAVSDTGLEPLICIWPKSALQYITKLLESGKNGPIPVLDNLHAIRIPIHEKISNYHPNIFLNINTRHQLTAHENIKL